MNTFLKFGNIFKGLKLSETETIDFWNSISFYNYVQIPTTKPRESPSKESFNTNYILK
jgi:hypothetical protein